MSHTLCACTARVALAHAARQRERWCARYFTTTEQEQYRDRGAASVAAALALKQAVAALYGDLGLAPPVTPRDIGVGHAASGAPRLTRLPPALRAARSRQHACVRVSMSHTRTHAYALAAYCAPRDRSDHE